MMKNFLLTLSLLFVSLISFGQLRTLNYQAVILDPKPIEIPGTNITGQPLKNGKVNVRFALISSSGSVDYEENHETTTDDFGLINLTIGSGLVNASGIASNSNSISYRTFDSIKWDSNVKQLKVSLSFDSGKKFTTVSLQPFNYTAYAFYAESVEYKNVRDSPSTLSFFNNDVGFIVSKDLDPLKSQIDQNQKDVVSKFLIINQSLSESDKKIADNSNEIAATKSKMGDISVTISNQGNQINDQNNRINANQEKVTGQINNLNSQIVTTETKVQNLENSYENAGNKSNNIQSDQASTNRYPSVKAVKDYVDQATQGVALQATVNGKEDKTSKSTDIKNDKNPTTNYPTVEAVKSYVLESALGIDTKIIIDGKENVSNKSRDVSADAGSNDKYPTVAAIKKYVDDSTIGVSLMAVINGKEDVKYKTNDITENNANYYPTAKAVKKYVDDATINSLSKEVQTISINPAKTIITLSGEKSVESSVTLPVVPSAESDVLGIVKLAGDLGGTASAPLINKIQGTSVSNIAPTSGQVMKYNGTNWIPTDDNSLLTETQKLALSGDELTLSNFPAEKINLGLSLKANASDVTSSLALKADLNSPTFTGTPSLPTFTSAITQSSGDNSTKIATTEFVKARILEGAPDAKIDATGKVQLAGDLGGVGTTATAPVISNNAITTIKIDNLAVTADKLAVDAVETDKIKDEAVNSDKLATSAVTTAKINEGAIIVGKLANNAVEFSKIQNIPSQTLLGRGRKSLEVGNVETLTLGTGLSIDLDGKLNSSGGTLTGVSGTADRISISINNQDDNAPKIDISSSYAGQNTITTVGTITSGTWSGTTVGVANGGTGATSFATGYVRGNGTSALTTELKIPVSDVTKGESTDNKSITFNNASFTDDTRYPSSKSVSEFFEAERGKSNSKYAHKDVDNDFDGINNFKGKVTISTTPTASNDAANKGYVDGIRDEIKDDFEKTLATNTEFGLIKLTNDLGGTAEMPTVNSVGGVSSSTITTINTSVANATAAATPSTIVKRDGSGNFSANMINSDVTGNLSGNATTSTSATTATNLAGNIAGSIPFQTGSGTDYTTAGPIGFVLKSNGANAPTWTELKTSDLTGTYSLTNTTGILPGANGGTGNNNGTNKIILGGDLTTAGSFSTAGNFSTSLTSIGATNVTLPTSGTLATLTGTETLTSKFISDGNANTQTAGDNSTKIATTAFVKSATPNAETGKKGLIQLSNDLGGTAESPTVIKVGEVSSSMIATMNISVGNATSTNTFNTIVKRDGAGNFAAGKITADLTGKVNDVTISGGITPRTLTVASDASVSGTNTGDQTIDQLINTGVENSGQYLRSNGKNAVLTAIQAGDLPISITTNGTSGASTYSSTTGVLNIPNYNLSSLGGVAGNDAITGSTKTKITYDSKGLVTAGAAATTADISDDNGRSDRKYVTTAQIDKIADSELSANKSPDTDLGANNANDTKFPTQKAVKVYVDGKIDDDRRKLNSHETKLGEHDTKFGQQDNRFSVDELRLSTAEVNIGTFSSTIADHKKRLGEAEGKIATAESSIISQGNDITLTKSDLGSQKTRLNTAEVNIGTFSTTLVDHDNRINTLDNRFKTDMNGWDATLAVGKILIGNESNKAQARSVSGDITLDKNGVTSLTDVLSSGTTSSTWGDATMIPEITLDRKGRVIAITERAVSGNLYRNFTLGKGRIFVGDKDNLASDVEMTGDVTIVKTLSNVEQTGETVIGEGKITSAKILDGTIINADIAANAAISDTKLGTISSTNKVTNSATSATASNTASAIVARDESGSFSANMITANVTGNLTGNASTATSATTATNLAGGSAGALAYQTAAGTTSFSGVGTAGQVLKSTGGSAPSWTTLSTADISGTITLTSQVTGILPVANGGTGVSTIPLDGQIDIGNGSGFTRTNLSAGTGISITNGPGTITITSTVDDADNTKTGKIKLGGDLGGTAMAPTVNTFGGVNTSTIQTINTSVGNATDAATPNTIVKRDVNGSFSANMITADLTGKATSLAGTLAGSIPYQTSNGTAYTTAGLSGNILKSNGENAPTWSSLSLTDINTGTISLTTQVAGVLPGANGGTGVANIGKTITLGGNLTTGVGNTSVSGSNTGDNAVNSLYSSLVSNADHTGDVTGSTLLSIAAGAVTTEKIANLTIVNADISETAAISDSKLANITTTGKVANSATTATPSNTVSTIVARDGTGNFTANTITGTLSGTASSATNLVGGSAGALAYQTAAGTTTFTNAGTSGQVLKSTGGSAPTWTSLSLTDITSGTISLTTQVSGILPGANGGTGVDNGNKLITLGGNLTTSGAFGTTLTSIGATNVTLPTSGTLSTHAGIETLTNKTITDGIANTQIAGDNSTKIATTAFVTTAIASLIREVDDEFITSSSFQTIFILNQTPNANSKVRMYINGTKISSKAYKTSLSSQGMTQVTYLSNYNGNSKIAEGARIQFEYYY